MSVLKHFTVAVGEQISMFTQKLGIKLFAAQGLIELQAQSDAIVLMADKEAIYEISCIKNNV